MYRVPQLVWGDAHAVQEGHSQLTPAQGKGIYTTHAVAIGTKYSLVDRRLIG